MPVNLIHRKKNNITYVSAPCGLGKTTNACHLTERRLRHDGNVMFALPTIKLTEEVKQKLVALGLKPIVIDSDHKQGKRSVRSAIMKALRNAPEYGLILLVTWNAFVDLPYFDRKQNWTIIIDEIPAVDSFRSWTLPRNSMFITDKIEVLPLHSDTLSLVVASNPSALRDELEDHKDDADEPFRELYGWLVSESRSVYVETAAWDRFLEQDGTDAEAATISFLALLKPKVFENTIIMGANFKDSLLYHWLYQHASYPIEEHSVLTGLLRNEHHDFLNRARIHYLIEKDRFSKLLKNTTVSGQKVVEIMDDTVGNFFHGKDFLWVHNNNDKESILSSLPNAHTMPVICHGLNEFSHYTNIYLSAALNRTPIHTRMMNALGFTSEMMIKATAHEIYYQAIMRTSLRIPDATDIVNIVVPDRGSAERIGQLLGVTQIGGIASPILNHESPLTQSQKNQRSKFHQAFQDLLYRKRLPNPYSYKGNGTHSGNWNPFISVTFHERKYDKSPDDFVEDAMSTGDFIATLRMASKTHLEEKERTYMFNPTSFVLAPGEDGLRRLANFHKSSFMVLDFDNGNLSPVEFTRLFGEKAPIHDRLSFVICNSFSRSTDEPNRCRVIIFYTKPATSIEQHHAVYDYLCAKLAKTGWGEKSSGLDRTCRTGIQSFYLPCTNRKYPDHALFETHSTRAGEIEQYGIDPEFLHGIVQLSSRATEHELSELDQFESVSENGVPTELIERDKATVESLATGRHYEFFMTGVRLALIRYKGNRLSPDSIERILMQTRGSEQKDRRKKVKDIMRSLRRYGLV